MFRQLERILYINFLVVVDNIIFLVYNFVIIYKEVIWMGFKVGDFVKHKLTGEKCLIIRQGREQFLIRTPDYKEIWAYAAELENA